MTKQKIISGLTATGKLTLGNYIGALKNILKHQEKDDVYLFVADLHAITLPIDKEELSKNIEENIKLYLSCGIDPKKTKLFKQSDIKEHLELFYILMTNSYDGELKRMTQFKDKSIKLANKTENIPVGLFLYPVLMAADIMIHNVDGVIVGQDQTQHIELTRSLIERMNKKYNLSFKIPIQITNKVGYRIMALKEPNKKMSKSDSDKKNTIFLLDTPDEVRNKISSSLTDSENKVRYDLKEKPGVSNLLSIYASIKEISIEDAEKYFKDFNYKDFKNEIINVINSLLETIQKKFYSLSKEDIKKSLDINIKQIKEEAKINLDKVLEGIGIK